MSAEKGPHSNIPYSGLTILAENTSDGVPRFPQLSDENPNLMRPFYKSFPYRKFLEKPREYANARLLFYEGNNKNDLTAFDSIDVFWRNVRDHIGLINRLSMSQQLPIPPREKNGVKIHLENMVNAMNETLWGIDLFIKSKKHPWEKALEIAESVHVLLKNQLVSEQIIALTEELNNSSGQDLNTIRQKIAQHAWDELIQKITYAPFSPEKISTIDDPKTERVQIHEAINGNLWVSSKKRRVKQKYEAKLKSMEENGYPKKLISYFRLLQETAMGKKSNQSAISILLCQEAILNILYGQNAFGVKDKNIMYDRFILEDLATDAHW